MKGTIVMKFCVNCGTQMVDEAKFCPDCGSIQENKEIPQVQAEDHVSEIRITNASEGDKVKINIAHTEKSAGSNIAEIFANFENKWQKIGYAGVALVVLGVFAPIIHVNVAMVKMVWGVFDFSSFLAVMIIVMCGGAGYLYSKGWQGAMSIAGNVMILLALEGYYMYKSAMDNLHKSMFGGFIKGGMIELEWGIYIFIASIICIQLAGVMFKDEKSLPSMVELFNRWKNNSVNDLELFSAKLSGALWTVILTVILSYIAYQSNVGKAMQVFS